MKNRVEIVTRVKTSTLAAASAMLGAAFFFGPFVAVGARIGGRAGREVRPHADCGL